MIQGKIKNITLSVPPGGTKTELVVINLIARGLALNPRSRFLHLSGSDELATLNSATSRAIVTSPEFQALWPMKISSDAQARGRWNVEIDGKIGGGVYATSLGGQVTGFRAGHMIEGFSGAILVDDPIKPEDAFSRPKIDGANRRFLTTVKSRKANPNTPIVLIMQRVAERDPVAFIEGGNVEGEWTHVRIPAVLDAGYLRQLPEKYQKLILQPEGEERFSYWPYKEPIQQLLAMERGEGQDQNGQRISRHVFSSQYQQAPKALGGNILKGQDFVRYDVLPKIKFRKVFADTAQKTKERNDYSVFEEWGYGENGKIYLIDLIRKRWEAPDLKRGALEFWNKCKARDVTVFGTLREMKVEDAASGTGLIQSIKIHPHNIPVKPIERQKDKLTRVMDAQPHIEAGFVCVPADAPFTSDFISECESFTADDSHDFDDQVDPLCDAIDDMLQSSGTLKQWEQLGKKGGKP